MLHSIRAAMRHRNLALGAVVVLLGTWSSTADANSSRGTRIDKLVIDLESGRVEVSGWSMEHKNARSAVPLQTGDASPASSEVLDEGSIDAGDREVTDSNSESALAAVDDVEDSEQEGDMALSTTSDEGDAEGDESEATEGAVLAENERAETMSTDQLLSADEGDGAKTAVHTDESQDATTSSMTFEDDDVIVAAHDTTPAPAVDIGAVAMASKKTARCGESVMLSAEASHSSAGPIAEYQWDFDGDGVFDDASGATVEYRLAALPASDGAYQPIPVGLQVVDASGNTAKTSIHIVPGPKADNQPPEVNITPRFLWVERESQEDVVIDASQTADPDGTCDHLQYRWTCESAGSGSCRTDSMELTGPVLRIPWQTLESDTTYFWKLTVTDIAGAQAIGSAVIESVRSIAPAQPVIEVNGSVRPHDGLRANCIYMADTNEPIWCAD